MWLRNLYSVLKLVMEQCRAHALLLRPESRSSVATTSRAALGARTAHWPALLRTGSAGGGEGRPQQDQSPYTPIFLERNLSYQWSVTWKLAFLYLENSGISICLPAPYPELCVFPRLLCISKWVIPIRRKQINPTAQEAHTSYKYCSRVIKKTDCPNKRHLTKSNNMEMMNKSELAKQLKLKIHWWKTKKVLMNLFIERDGKYQKNIKRQEDRTKRQSICKMSFRRKYS